MGELAFSGVTSHVGAIIKNPHADLPGSARLHRAWDELDAHIDAIGPDAMIVVATDHYETFGLDHYPVFCLGVAEEHRGWGEFGTPGGLVAGRAELASALHAGLIARDFDVAVSYSMRLDHSFLVPVTRLPSVGRAGVVPLFVNCNTPPLPSLARCHALGQAIRSAVRRLPDGARVGVLATGGISHWVGLPRFGEVNEEFDTYFLELLMTGRVDAILEWSDEKILAEAGNGALEIRTWLVAAAAAGGAPLVASTYAAMPTWGIGVGVGRFEVDARSEPAGEPLTQSVYGITKLAWDLEHANGALARFRDDPHAVLAEYPLTEAERDAILRLRPEPLLAGGVNPVALRNLFVLLGVTHSEMFRPISDQRFVQ